MRLIQRNYHCRLGEIDLIMEHQNTLVFVEVRYRHRHCYGSAEESITPTKRRKLIATARHYLLNHPDFRAWPGRFDVVCMGPGTDPAIIRDSLRWLPNAFQAG
ncbi:MAG: YraN family protein [Gammaproteobacteria bacterium]|nr:MAG: YraN family protein [Gammaproteobacteria bacterium]